ncbi:MAG TPA: fibrobacter succinogenes major paralogous domain-containing protein [Bacteroidales bacterium]|nr:fibrobacter succinogenes major paralogous domain-containing protein [Bacteroidales bacterium]HPT10716.1 fibrobacter succinogenes major paralogous domain-containing protein [Bacteroidales bacterium]
MKTIMVLIFTSVFYNATWSQVTDTLVDPRDSKIYQTIKIGDQTWMAQNIDFKTKGFWWCYKDDSINCEKYGKLYRWESAMKACPKGWHLPSDNEWKELFDFLGGSKIAGGKMKSTNGWIDDEGTSTNSSGFNAIPSGQGLNTGAGIGGNRGVGYIAVWWSATKPELSFNPHYVFVNNQGDKVKIEECRPNMQFSVRCVKDIKQE